MSFTSPSSNIWDEFHFQLESTSDFIRFESENEIGNLEEINNMSSDLFGFYEKSRDELNLEGNSWISSTQTRMDSLSPLLLQQSESSEILHSILYNTNQIEIEIERTERIEPEEIRSNPTEEIYEENQIYSTLSLNQAILSFRNHLNSLQTEENPKENRILNVLKVAQKFPEEISKFHIEFFEDDDTHFFFKRKQGNWLLFDSKDANRISFFLLNGNARHKFNFASKRNQGKGQPFFKNDFSKRKFANCGKEMISQEFRVKGFEVILNGFTFFPYNSQNPILILCTNRRLEPVLNSVGQKRSKGEGIEECSALVPFELEEMNKRRRGEIIYKISLTPLEKGKQRFSFYFKYFEIKHNRMYDVFHVKGKRSTSVSNDELYQLIEFFFHSRRVVIDWAIIDEIEDRRLLKMEVDKYLSFNTNKIEFSTSNFTGEEMLTDMKSFKNTLNNSPNLQKLYISYPDVENEGLKILCSWIPTCTIESLILVCLKEGTNEEFRRIMISVIKAVGLNPFITKLKLEAIDPQHEDLMFELIGNLLQARSNLVVVDVNFFLPYSKKNEMRSRKDMVERFVNKIGRKSSLIELKFTQFLHHEEMERRKKYSDELKDHLDQLWNLNNLETLQVFNHLYSRDLGYSNDFDEKAELVFLPLLPPDEYDIFK